MSKQLLTIEQMKHLKELGVDVSKASMHYWIITNGEYSQETGEYVFSKEPTYTSLMLYPYKSTSDAAIRQVKDIPAFTLQDILNILPNSILSQDENNDYWLEIGVVKDANKLWYIRYKSMYGNCINCEENENLIDAAYKMLCWTIENDDI